MPRAAQIQFTSYDHGRRTEAVIELVLCDDLRGVAVVQDKRGAIQAPENFETSFIRGRLALLEKDYPTAIDYFQDAVQKEPSVANHWIFLSRATSLAGDENRAKEVLCQGILMETDRPITNNLFPDLDCDSQ